MSEDSNLLKIKELENEIYFLKAENEKLSYFKAEKDNIFILKGEYENLLSELNKEVENFYFIKETEKKEFEKWKEEEIKKINKEKKSSEKFGKINQNVIPSRKDKDEIESLKNLISKIQDEFKIKDNNNKLNSDKLKRKLEESNIKINELNKNIEEISLKNTLIRSNSINFLKNNNNTISHNNLNSRKILNYNDINSHFNQSTNLTPSTQELNSNNDDSISNKNNFVNKSKYNDNKKLNTNHKVVGEENINSNKSRRDSKDIKEIPKKDNSDFNSSEIHNYNEINKKSSFELDKNTTKSVKFNNSLEQHLDLSDNDDGVYDLVFLEKYHPKKDLNLNVVKNEKLPDGKIVKFFENEKREVLFPSGVRKEIFTDGYQIVYFNNKDIKQVNF